MFRIKKIHNRLFTAVIITILIIYCFDDFVTDKSSLHNIEIKLKLIEDEIFIRSKELEGLKIDVESLEINDKSPEVANDRIYEGIKDDRLTKKDVYRTKAVRNDVDIQMLDLYKRIPFQNQYGGEWTQGWKIEYNNDTFNEHNKLKVFVVPHSHNDPGWLRTYDEYYERVTQHILFTSVNFLTRHPDMKFIWAEISFFSKWYDSIPEGYWKDEVKALVNRGQLEFVTGGWVMPDEASSHWLGITIQLAEGQSWLKKNFNTIPKSGWAIDPFGHSSTMSYLLKKAEIKDMLIQRTHYEVKKQLAREKSLEFHWRQIWDRSKKYDMFTHMMPFVSYSAPYSCGPDPKICCQFDFERLPGKGRKCKWGIPPEEITNENLETKAHLLLDQWRKKSTLYRTNSLLVPLGDDFRYTHTTEWKDQYQNYKKLFKYLNNKKELHIEAKFATLEEYFTSVHKENFTFPSLSGDFFTYSDQDDHYWSGYYTSRPYHKRMERALLHYLRSAEMMYSWNKWQWNNRLSRRLRNATQALSLFQHHDAITGTAREHVVNDYERMLNFAVASCKFVMQQAAFRLLTDSKQFKVDYQRTYFELDESNWPGLGENGRTTINFSNKSPCRIVSFHNSLPQWRKEIIELQVSTPYIKVQDSKNESVLAQVSPCWAWHHLYFNILNPQAFTSKFILNFEVKVPPLGLSTYLICHAPLEEIQSFTSFANVTIMTPVPFSLDRWNYPFKARFKAPDDFEILTKFSTTSFSKNGFLQTLSGKNNSPKIPIHLEFLKYGTKSWFADERSGAYLFLPGGPAEPFEILNPTVIISEGEIESSVTSGLPFAIHKTILRGEALEIRNYVDIGTMDNSEIVMRITTNINSENVFYTDVNSFQISKRIRQDKLPLQANYYPVPSAIYIEDELHRLTLLSAQPLGGSSLTSGQIDVMQDRRLSQSDGRGLGEGVMDNKPVMHIFRLLLESRENCPMKANYPGGALTGFAHHELKTLSHPIDKFIFKGVTWPGIKWSFGRNHISLENDFEVGILQNLPEVYQDGGQKSSTRRGLILHRTEVDSCGVTIKTDKVNVRRLVNLNESEKLYEASLTFVKKGQIIKSDEINFHPMDIKSFIIHR